MCFMLVFSAAANFKHTKTLCNCRRGTVLWGGLLQFRAVSDLGLF